MTEPKIRVSREGAVYVIELNRAEALNALTSEMFDGLEKALDDASHSDARAILICSSIQKAFSVGTDLNEIARLSPDQMDARNAKAQRILGTLRTHGLLTFAHVCGYALGGGLELALSCSVRLLSPQASLGLPEIKLGVVPTYGGIHTLSELVREDVALDMLTSGRSLDANESMRAGLGTRQMRCAERSEAFEVLGEFTRHSLAAQELVRKALTSARRTPPGEPCADEIDAIRVAVRLRDFGEGVAAFLEKRQAAFRDK
ncbi:putative 3-hydroxypropionyl-coenzyme A dehydratase [Paraburkholderia piptadeniae]|uniref:3-hydroxypropionyl-coenzyme A dehydratase n=1 Tax=Paraburkholderia piptadeniae TaxID=1701573 RepID=A0A1N7RIN3_9BURK|nr:enoyl-CoA hydratase/isomerase family protein [Paraburkholderia piptadeniae]SIT34945.1 putative 3-hydroxypropionyl-coenzyme A dehydratase [Paraburkholderia piptadeniae]